MHVSLGTIFAGCLLVQKTCWCSRTTWQYVQVFRKRNYKQRQEAHAVQIQWYVHWCTDIACTYLQPRWRFKVCCPRRGLRTSHGSQPFGDLVDWMHHAIVGPGLAVNPCYEKMGKQQVLIEVFCGTICLNGSPNQYRDFIRKILCVRHTFEIYLNVDWRPVRWIRQSLLTPIQQPNRSEIGSDVFCDCLATECVWLIIQLPL